jgi:capsular polysaccharide biosynthesis protein
MTDTYPTRSLRELARIIFTRLVGIVLILVVVLAGVIAVSILTEWKYRSSSLLLARPAAPLTDLEGRASMRDRVSLFVVTQRELIKSDYVVTSALMKLDGWDPDGPLSPEGQQWYEDETVEKFAADNAGRVARGRGAVRVETPGGPDVTFTQTYNVTVTWSEEREVAAQRKRDARKLAAERCQLFAKHLVSAYLARRAAVEAKYAKQSAEFLVNKAAAAAEQKLKAAASDLEQFAAEIQGDLILIQNMLGGIGEMGPQSLRTKFEAEIRTIEARLGEIDALVAAINKELVRPAGQQVAVPLSMVKANPGLARIQVEIVKLQLKINELSPRYTDGFKELKQTRAELAANLDYQRRELSRQKAVLEQEKAVLSGRRQRLDQIVKASRDEIARLAKNAARYQTLRDNLENAQGIYNKRLEEAAAAQNAQTLATVPMMEVLLVDPPSRPDPARPHRPILWLNVLVGALAALILALIYAFLADHLDHTVKGGEDVERHIGVSVLASIPKYRRRIVRAK